jgi:hypothetical protein
MEGITAIETKNRNVILSLLTYMFLAGRNNSQCWQHNNMVQVTQEDEHQYGHLQRASDLTVASIAT